jgi:alanine racemase
MVKKFSRFESEELQDSLPQDLDPTVHSMQQFERQNEELRRKNIDLFLRVEMLKGMLRDCG